MPAADWIRYAITSDTIQVVVDPPLDPTTLQPVDPTGDTVQLAFLTDPKAQPADADFMTAATWTKEVPAVPNGLPTYVATGAVGVGSTVTTKGRFYVWIRLTLTSTKPIAMVGILDMR